MPLRFYRRFRARPFRMNVSKRGVSYSVGTRGLWFTAGRRHIRTSIGLPGTGLGWYERRRLPRPVSTSPAPAPILPAPNATQWIAIAGIIVVIVGTVLFVAAGLMAG
jgi:hypothetical protein